ncbi:MAG: alpha/beta hydrolase fold domain-containing protein [Pseudomonadota bacterium]
MTGLDWVHGDPAELRAAYSAERAVLDASAPPEVDIAEDTRPGLGGLRFTPPEPKGAPILYFHGGSWMLGAPETHRALCAWLAKLSGRRVLSVRYPLAPEHRYPAQRDAARGALAAALGAEAGGVFVAGDSAGGAMALWAAEDECVHVRGVVAFYPAFGVTASPSIERFGPGHDALHAEAIAAMYERLGVAPKQVQADVPTSGAPVLVIAASHDPLFDDSTAVFDRLEDREVTLWVAEGEEHAFLHHGGSRPNVRDWLTRTGVWMDEREGAAGS